MKGQAMLGGGAERHDDAHSEQPQPRADLDDEIPF